MDDVEMDDGDDDRVIVMDTEVAAGLQQDEWGGMDGDGGMDLSSEQEESGESEDDSEDDWEDDIGDDREDDNDNDMEDAPPPDNEDEDVGAVSGAAANQTVANNARQRDQVMHDLHRNWGCTTIQDAFPSKPNTWLKGSMDMEKKRFNLEDFDIETLLLLQQLSSLTMGKSKEIKEKMAVK
jgi:hypothetical protein